MSSNSGRTPIILGMSGQPVSTTAVTSVQTLANITIPQGAMSANGALRVWISFDFTSSTNAKTFIVQLGGQAVLNIATSTAGNVWFGRALHIHNRGVMNSQSVAAIAAGSALGFQSSGSAITNVDMNSVQNLTIMAQVANTSDTITLTNYSVELLNFV